MPIPSSAPAAERQLLRDTIRDRLRSSILDGTLEPGERLHDEQLMSWLGVSRTPLREALADLARAGLVELSPNRYTRVAVPLEKDALDAIRTLGVLFGGAVRLAVPLLPEPALKTVVTGIDVCLDDLASNNAPALNAHTVAVFDTYVQHCGNSALQNVCRDVTDGLAYKLRLPNIAEYLNWDNLTTFFTDLQEATLAREPIAAELAAEALHGLPGQRPA